MRVLVTGITGFAGGHLAEALLAGGNIELFGLSRKGCWPAEWHQLGSRVSLRSCDVCDGAGLETLLRETRPDHVYHLAGYAHVGQSFKEADAAWAGNLTATRCLYEAVIRWGGKPRILHIGSGMIYGDAETPDQAFAEHAPLRPTSPYAASKAAADLASYQYTRSGGLDIVRARPFNHVGPHQSAQFAVAHFAQQIAAIEAGRRPPILETGNLSPRRDLTDVRDVVRAYIVLLHHGRTGEAYNVGSGETHAMQEIVDRLLALARLRIEVRQQPHLIRATETKAVRADTAKLRRETGWTPRHSLDETLTDTLAYWRDLPHV